MKRTTVTTIVVILLVATTSLFAWKREFAQKFSSQNSWDKRAAIMGLNPDDKSRLKMLFKVLKMNDWYLRKAAWESLSRVSSSDSKDYMKKELGRSSSSRARIREGIALAMGKAKNREFVPEIIELLDDRIWFVQRSAARALAMMPDKRSVPALIKTWKKEKKQIRVWVNCRMALEKITGQYLGNNVIDWSKWWSIAKDNFTVGTGGDSSKAEAKGHKTKKTSTVLRGVKLDFSSRGQGPPLFVLPDFGYNEKYIVPYLAPLEDIRKIFYIKLPPISSFQNPKRVAGRIVYPVDQLCDAFDELRKKYKQKRIGIFGHGVSAWVAMRYATKYPRNVRSLIIVSSWPNQMSYRKGVEKLEAYGKRSRDQELEHFAQSLQIMPTGQPKYMPKGMADQRALMRKEWTIRFADQGDAVLGKLHKESYKPSAGAIVPDFDLYKQPKYRIPTLVIFGKYAMFTNRGDGQKMAQHFSGRFLYFSRSRRTPFIEENRRFIQYVRRFFGSK